MTDPIVFDRLQVRRQRDRAAATIDSHAFLLDEATELLADRLLDVTRPFPRALDLGCHTGQLGRALRGRGGIETLIQCDLSPRMAQAAGGLTLAADEEALPFAAESFDLVLSALSLHWVNDLPGTLAQIRRILKPDGLLLATLFGGETLGELRQSFIEAELAEEGGAGQRVSPFVDLRDGAALLQRAGFDLPVADIEVIPVTYGDPIKLFQDLRHMGETNAASGRRRSLTRRATLLRCLEFYRQRFSNPDGRLKATFQLITLTGWRPPA